jgi:hypothetical protein
MDLLLDRHEVLGERPRGQLDADGRSVRSRKRRRLARLLDGAWDLLAEIRAPPAIVPLSGEQDARLVSQPPGVKTRAIGLARISPNGPAVSRRRGTR